MKIGILVAGSQTTDKAYLINEIGFVSCLNFALGQGSFFVVGNAHPRQLG